MWNNYSTEQTEVSWVSLMLCKINATKSYEKVNNKRTKISLQTLYSFVLVLCLVTQWCPTLCDPVDCSPPSSSVHGILQARILEGVAISFSRGSSQPRDWTQVSCIAGRFFTIWATREAPLYTYKYSQKSRKQNKKLETQSYLRKVSKDPTKVKNEYN